MGPFVTIDLVQLLDRSITGSDAAKALHRQWKEAEAEPEEQRQKIYAELDAKRDTLRKVLIERAKPIIAELTKKNGAQAALDKSVVAWSEALDITVEVSARVDALGPLKL